jgi:hypothetical protein
MDASHLQQQTVSFSNLHHPGAQQPLDPAEFIAQKDLNRSSNDNEESEANEGVTSDDDTVLTDNLSHSDFDPSAICPIHPTGHHKWGECSHNPNNIREERGTLQFSPTPIRDDAEIDNDAISASDDQAELLRWHWRLGHISFSHLKRLAEIGEIPKKLAKAKGQGTSLCRLPIRQND